MGGSSSQVEIELHCVVGEIWVQSPTATPICLSNGGKGGPGGRASSVKGREAELLVSRNLIGGNRRPLDLRP